ncbi:MAG TPA: outer membrane beta-barrel protein [Bacteroidales bacterium]|nr:outer membrane beta-barrel protein [Bacteroidales bacterium]HPS63442.1 outer membrane beta-barrel protein [Bacteroidales bacterium]
MKKFLLTVFLAWMLITLHAQNFIGFQVGYLGTHTSIAEYERIERRDFLLDSMSIRPDVGSIQAELDAEFGLGKRFFLATAFHYSNKGLANVTFTDSTGWPWQTAARQKYAGLTVLIGYKLPLGKGKWGLMAATGPRLDVAIGTPNGGALFSGPYYRFFMPFSRFNEIDLGWALQAGATYRLGPGEVRLKLHYTYGLSDVLEDAFVVARSMSYGATIGYAVKL